MKKTQKILDLKPTQFAVGMLEVDEKIKAVKAMTKKELKAFKHDTVPVVRGPDKQLYVVDKHHYLSVCYHLGIKKVDVEVVKDVSKKRMNFRKFWDWMRKTRNSYPYCQFGEGPRNELYLPEDVRGMADDPYRSIAWFVRKAGGFDNSEKNFAEFAWANFFREKKLLDTEGKKGFEKALLKAVELAQSKEASNLPGFGMLKLPEKKEVKKRVIKRARGVQKTEMPAS